MASLKEYAALRGIMEKYATASYESDVNTLKSVFHPQVLMSGYLDGDVDIGPPDPWYKELLESPSSKQLGEAYRAEITFIHIAGPMASAGLVEDNLQGKNYVNHFHFLKIDGEWRIVSKIYISAD